MSFEHEVPRDTSSISLRSADGTLVEFDMTYGKKDLLNQSGAVMGSLDDKTVLKITPRSPLKKDVNYTLVILRKTDPGLPSDQIAEFHTARELKLSAFNLISNTLGCIYANNKL